MLKFYNTLSGKKEIFKPRKNKNVNLFVCGPTVYDFSHIGHARTYIVFDTIAKYLKEIGYKVFYLQNITDVDDKIIKRANEKNVSWKYISRKFETEYLNDVKSLNINSVKKYARATSHIKEIISQVERLMKKGFAYKINDGIYYDISKFKNYGKLSKRTVLQAEDSVSRIDESIEKRNKGDFCLWKFSKKGEPKWKSPFGWGRPGWHIEDTAITEKYFGPQYDIHGGARDLIFPHHEAEIAQMEAISGKEPMVKYWLHSGFLTVNGQKMAKSLGNFITIKDFLKKYSPRFLRIFILKTHYHSPINYDEKEIEQVKKQLKRIDELVEKIKKLSKKSVKILIKQKEPVAGKTEFKINEYIKRFYLAINDDFNTPKAIAVIFEITNKANFLISKNKLTKNDADKILNFFKKIDKFLNFIFLNEKIKKEIPLSVKKMVNERESARKEKNWKLADEIRKKIEKLGYKIEDTKNGSKLKKK